MELCRAALGSIRAHPLRSFLTLLGVIIGVTTIVGVAAVISGLNDYVAGKIIRLSPDVFVVTKFGIIQSREEFLEALRRPDIAWRDVERLASLLTRATTLAADVSTRGAVRHQDRRLADVTIHGTTGNFGEMMGLDLAAGRYVAESDDRAGAAVAVIGWDVKEELFPQVDPVGRTVLVGDAPYRVIGLIAKQGRTLGQSQDNQVFLPIRTFRQAYGSRNSIDVLIRARGGVPGVDAAADEVRSILRAVRHTPFRDPDPFGIVTAESLQTLWRQISKAAFVLTLLIAAVSLGIGGVVIMNIMFVGVVERTREIGVRLALGARKRDIRRQFLLEAAVLSTGGGLLGASLGALASLGVETVLQFPARLTPPILFGALLISSVVGLLAGYLPARSASNLVVVDALRDET